MITLKYEDYRDALIRAVNAADNYSVSHGRKLWDTVDRVVAEQEMERNWPRKTTSFDSH